VKRVNKEGRAEIHQALLSQFYQLAEFLIGKVLVKQRESKVGESQPTEVIIFRLIMLYYSERPKTGHPKSKTILKLDIYYVWISTGLLPFYFWSSF
jgi:hypothetical protein